MLGLRWVLVGIVMTVLGGCQASIKQRWIRDRAQDYISSQVAPPLQVPAPLVKPYAYDSFTLPDPLPTGWAPVPVEPPEFLTFPEGV